MTYSSWIPHLIQQYPDGRQVMAFNILLAKCNRIPDNPDYHFVEMEDTHGHSFNIGEWAERQDGSGLWEIRARLDIRSE